MAAWLASRRGDREWERQALEHVNSVDPTDSAALDRLAALATERGDANRAEQLRQQKTQIGQIFSRYQTLYERYQPVRDAPEMATQAERLGRRFEARAFKTLAVAIDPERNDLKRELARLELLVRQGDEPKGDEPKRTLADAFADEPGPPSGESTPRVFSATPPAPGADPALLIVKPILAEHEFVTSCASRHPRDDVRAASVFGLITAPSLGEKTAMSSCARACQKIEADQG